MAKTYRLDKKINDILLSSLRMVNAYTDTSEVEPEKIEEALSAFQDIVNHLEARGFSLFKKVTRQRILDASDIVAVGTNYYRCFNQNTVPEILSWTASNGYIEGDCVYPSLYNGYYYKCQTSGISGEVEPSFEAIQNSTLTDNEVVWVCVADTRPEIGANYRTYWILDTTQTSGDEYTTGKTYKSSGDFQLQQDELYITSAHTTGINNYQEDLCLIGSEEYNKIYRKSDTGTPEYLYIEHTDIYDNIGHIYPIPKTVGIDGTVLHYEVVLKIAEGTDALETSGFIDSYFRYLKFCLTSDIAPENGISWEQNIYLDKKADKLFNELKGICKPKKTSRRLKKCY